MPRYFFHTQCDVAWDDQEGTELPNVEGAKNDAVQLLVELLRNNSKAFWDAGDFTVTVADDKGLTLLTLSLMATMSPCISSARPRGVGPG
jgi:hypothetical protein